MQFMSTAGEQFLNLNFFYFQNLQYWLTFIENNYFYHWNFSKTDLHTKYGWNNPNWGRLGLKSQKLHFFAISGSSKIHRTQNIQIHVTGFIFIVNRFFLNASNNVLCQNKYQLKSPKTANYGRTVALSFKLNQCREINLF